MKKKIISLGSILILISLLTTICLASGSEPVDLTDHNSSLEEKYKNFGINLEEELQKGNLYKKNGKYFIKFKELELKKDVISDLKKYYDTSVKKISLKDALRMDALLSENKHYKTIDDLKFFLNLKSLDLNNNVINDLNALKYLKNLTSLSLVNNNLNDIQFLKYVTFKLEYLNLGNNQIKNIQSIRNLVTLKNLTLYGNKIEDLSVLSSLDELEELWLMDNHLKTLKGLESLDNLAFLYVDANPLTVEGLEPIEKLNLYELTIDRKVFDGIVFAKYPEFLWNIEILEFIEEGENE